MTWKKLLIAVDSELLARGVAGIAQTCSDIEISAVTHEAGETLAAVQRHEPDGLILSTRLVPPLAAELDALPRRPRILLLSNRLHPGIDLACARGCACGFVRSSMPLTDFSGILARVMACTVPNAGRDECRGCPLPKTLNPSGLPLSPRELEVFIAIGKGHGNTRIAADLNVSIKTVEAFRENIKRKLQIQNAAELHNAAVAWRNGRYVYVPPTRHTQCRPQDAKPSPL